MTLAVLVDQSLLDRPPTERVLDAAAAIADRLGPIVGDTIAATAPLAALILAGVFTVAAGAKLAEPATARREFAALGLPAPAALARVVPPAEFVIALLLLVRPAAGGLAAALALLAFTAVLTAAVRAGRSVSCGCLGPLSRRPVTVATLVRNLGLIALSAIAATTPTPTGLTPTLPAGEVVLAVGPAVLLVALVLQTWVLRNQIGRIWSVELAGERPTRGGRRLDAAGLAR